MEKNNKFIKPMMEIVAFTNDDIITSSGEFGDTNRGTIDLFPKDTDQLW